MKRILYILMAVCLIACHEDDSITTFSVNEESLTVDATGGMEQISLTAGGDWTASSNVQWLSVAPASGTGSATLSIQVDSALTHLSREGFIRIVGSDQTPVIVKISQMGYGNQITFNQEEISLAYSDAPSKRLFEVKVSANLPFAVEVQYAEGDKQWIKPRAFELNLERGARPRTATLEFEWDMNADARQRIATIGFVPVDQTMQLDAPAQLRVCQEAAPKIEDNREGDSLSIVLMHNRLQSLQELSPAENMMYWENVTLWETTDSDLPCPEAVGRIREASFMLFTTEESLPAEVAHLKYVEKLSFYGNINAGLKNIELGTEVCQLKHLKKLQIAAYGLVSLPEELAQLGGTLESLDINSNNFDDIPSVLTPENFPKLRKLNISTCRRRICLDLREKGSYEDGIGMNISFATKPRNRVRDLFLWNNLEQLALSYNYIEGELPEFKVGEDGVEAWTNADVEAWGGDTIRNVVGMPKVLPNTTDLRINLNYFTGKLPDWILYHPHLLDWNPDSFIFTTQEKAVNSSGKMVGFSNVPTDFEYYYEFYPKYRSKYEQ